MEEGPRHPEPGEMPSLSELLDRVFRPRRAEAGERDVMLNQFPQLFNEDNRDHLWVFVDGARVVAHVGVFPRWMIVEGYRVGAALIGAVGALEEYRGRGLATRLMDAAVRQAVAERRPLMCISGGRGLYKRLGATGCARKTLYSIDRAAAARLAEPGLVLRDAGPADVPAMMALYRRHTVRNGRYPHDFRRALDIRFAMNRPSVFKMIGRAGETGPRAYLIAQRQDAASPLTGIGESGGDCRAVAGAIHALLQTDPIQGAAPEPLTLAVMPGDLDMQGLLASAGLPGTPAADGTALVTDPVRLWKDLDGYQAERLGPDLRLKIRVKDGTATFAVKRAEWSCPAEEMSRVLLGNVAEPVPRADPGPVADALAQLTPIPLAPYGLSFV